MLWSRRTADHLSMRLKINQKLTRGVLACSLLFWFGMSTSACPLPVYDLDPELNSAVEVTPELVQPSLATSVKVALNCNTTPIQFRLEPALFDADGDTINIFWLVNNEDDIGNVDAVGPDFDFDPCSPPASAIDDDFVLIEAFVMDRAPSAFDAAGVHTTTEDGSVTRISWNVEITERGDCFCL